MINAGTVAAYLTLDTSSFDSGIDSALLSISGFNAGAELIKRAADSIKSVMLATGKFIKDGFSSAMSMSSSAVNGGVGAILQSITRLPYSAASSVRAFSSEWRGIGSAVEGSRSVVAASCGGIVTSAMGALGRLPDSAKGIMVQTGLGMAAGLNSTKGLILSAAQSIASSVASKMRSALGIHSPSRVMMEIGRYTVEGMALGMGENLDMVRREAENAAGAVVKEMSDISLYPKISAAAKSSVHAAEASLTGNYSANGNADGGNLDVIAEKLDRCIKILGQSNTSLEIDGRSFGRLVREYV